MDLIGEERPSTSPYIQTVWRSHSDGQSGSFISVAQGCSGIVVSTQRGKTIVTVRGPETKPTPAYYPANAEFFGILFKPGVFLPSMPVQMLMDRQDVHLPEASGQSFYLNSSVWQFPTYDNVEVFVDRLVREETLVCDPVVDDVTQGQSVGVSPRTVQRRFLQATGMSQTMAIQIERARYATILLNDGVSILDTVDQAGYFDQPHLTRSLKRFTGLTPAQIANPERPERLSLLYKTALLLLRYDETVQDATVGDHSEYPDFERWHTHRV